MPNPEYHEVYGYLPKVIINRLSDEEKYLILMSWFRRGPTTAGTVITQLVIKALGPGFLEYLALQVAQVDMIRTRESILEGVNGMLESFYTDSNILCEYVEDYLEEHKNDRTVVNRIDREMTIPEGWGDNPGKGPAGPGIMDLYKKTLAEEKAQADPTGPAGPVRDPKTGRFVKKK